MTIVRPDVTFDGASHTYTLNGEKLAGVSSISKMGEALSAFSTGSAWGWRLGYEGAYDVVAEAAECLPATKEQLRDILKQEGLTPWSTRDRAADRGTWVHDILEGLATGDGQSDPFTDVINQLDGERRGHAQGLLQWYLDFRPEFVATEVMVASETHGFAGRYDIRCKITDQALQANGIFLPVFRGQGLVALCLADLKTSKHIYPLSHYVQLEGYEGASVEMGFPPTDLRMVINTKPDGTYHVGISYATYEDFLAYLGAYKAIKRLEAADPVEVAKREMEQKVMTLLPAVSSAIAGVPGCPATSREVGMLLGRLRKRGLVEQDVHKVWTRSAS